MGDDYELSIGTTSYDDVTVPESVRGRIWDMVASSIEDFQGKRLKTVDKQTDSVAAFFGGPTEGQSSWARECLHALSAMTGEDLAEENESDFQTLKRRFVEYEPKWMVAITEYLLQGWARGRDGQFNEVLKELGVPVRFENGRAGLATDSAG